MTCKHNLQQIGLALHKYHDVFATFPPGWVLKDEDAKAGPSFAWQARVLPFVHEARYTSFRLSHAPALDSSESKYYRRGIEVYRCPADDIGDVNDDRGGFGATNYVGNYGVELIPEESDATPGSGFFYRNSSVYIGDVRDGTSNTIIAGERSSATGAGIWSIVRSNGQAEDAVATSNDEKKINTVEESYSSKHEGGAYFLLCDGSVRF
ncbi:MAG: DUF1559 domain-containing protein, partial [Planctomycetaceae bacterium]